METKKVPNQRTNDPAANPDPITKAPGAHPVGTGVGAAAGGAAGIGAAIAGGAVAGSVAGPVGSAVGAVVGAVAGGLIGKGLAEKVNPSIEHAYWRETYKSRPYAASATSYDEFAPAYQYGWESRSRHADKRFEDVEWSLQNDWSNVRGASPLSWEQAKPAARDAWDRIESGKK